MCDFAMRLNWLHTIVLSVLLGLVPIAHAQKEIAMPTPKGNLTLLFGGFLKQDDWGGVRLQAAIRNDTPFTFESVMFAMYGYDANGQDVCCVGRME